jgi:hypothetical protein
MEEAGEVGGMEVEDKITRHNYSVWIFPAWPNSTYAIGVG